MASYASPADILKRYDARTLGDLVSDTGLRVDSTALLADENLQAALDDASGEIEVALIQGRRYKVSDLTALTGNSKNYLKRIVSQIAFGLLWERRPWSDEDQRQEAMVGARKALERLRRGEHVFELDAPQDAGLPSVSEPTISSYRTIGLTVDEARRGYYPARRFPTLQG